MACPQLSMLVTSREPSRCAPSSKFPWRPLPAAGRSSSAAGRARPRAGDRPLRATSPGHRAQLLTEDNALVIAAICQRLDGLPWPSSSPRRESDFAAASSAGTAGTQPARPHRGPRDAPARQRTLRDAIAWSHDLLEGDEPTLFRRLAVFSGGWTLEAAEAVVSDDGALDVFTGITALADKSLVRPVATTGPDPRFGMLETIREFGLEQLTASGEIDTTRRRHAEYLVAFSEALSADLFRATEPELLERLAAEHDNVRAALVWLEQQGDEEAMIRLAAGLGWFWFVRVRHGGDFVAGAGPLAPLRGRWTDSRGCPELGQRAHAAEEGSCVCCRAGCPQREPPA